MDGRGSGIAERRSRLEAAREALAGFGEALPAVPGPQLAEVLELVDEVVALASAARMSVVVEAARRGEACGSGAHGWVREHAPSLRQGGGATVARLAVEVAGAGALGTGTPDPTSPVGIVWAAVRAGRVDPGTGCAVLREAGRLTPLLQDQAVPTVTGVLVELAEQWGATVMRRLRPRLLAEYGRDGALDDLHQRLAAVARLSAPRVESGDLTEYQLWMTPEQAATLEAAIGPLSAPAPGATGERDLRPAGQRRVEALTEVCRRSTSITAGGAGVDVDASSPAVLHVTMDLAGLRDVTGAGEVVGSTADGTLLAPADLRRIACEAALIPYVLGTDGEVLDVGRVARLFTRAQRRLLRRRDRGCTYPGCTAAPDWTRAHHVRHWVDGGSSDVTNAALLCQRHHTVVHTRRLWAHVREHPDDHGRYVVWDLTDGSYDRRLRDHPPPGGAARPAWPAA